jgi:hypothetical protein
MRLGNMYFALSGLRKKLGDQLNPGRWPGLRYFAPLGLKKLHGDRVLTGDVIRMFTLAIVPE